MTMAGIGAAIGCLVALSISWARARSPAELMQPLEYDGLYHLHRVPRKRLVRQLGDPVPAFVPSRPSRSALVMEAARDRNRVDMIESQLHKAKQQMLDAHVAEEHRGLMAQSRHGSARLFRLLSHQEQGEKKALAMAAADFEARPNSDSRVRRGRKDEATAVFNSGGPSKVSSDGTQENEGARETRRSGMGALDLVQEKDENVLGSLGGEEAQDEMNRDGSLSSSSNDRNTLGSLFAVRAPSRVAEDEAEKSRPKSALSFRYRTGHWSRDGLLWIVGDGERQPYHAQKDLKSGLYEGRAKVAHGSDAKKGVDDARSGVGLDADDRVAALKDKVARMKEELHHLQGDASPDAHAKLNAGAQAAAKGQVHSAPSVDAPKVKHARKPETRRAGRRGNAAAVASHATLSTGPLSLKRLLKDFGQYETAFASFFSDDSQPKARPRFARAASGGLSHKPASAAGQRARGGDYWVGGTVS